MLARRAHRGRPCAGVLAGCLLCWCRGALDDDPVSPPDGGLQRAGASLPRHRRPAWTACAPDGAGVPRETSRRPRARRLGVPGRIPGRRIPVRFAAPVTVPDRGGHEVHATIRCFTWNMVEARDRTRLSQRNDVATDRRGRSNARCCRWSIPARLDAAKARRRCTWHTAPRKARASRPDRAHPRVGDRSPAAHARCRGPDRPEESEE